MKFELLKYCIKDNKMSDQLLEVSQMITPVSLTMDELINNVEEETELSLVPNFPDYVPGHFDVNLYSDELIYHILKTVTRYRPSIGDTVETRRDLFTSYFKDGVFAKKIKEIKSEKR